MRHGEGLIDEVFEEATDGLLLVDGGGVCLDANAAACSLLDIEADRLRGQPVTTTVTNETDDRTGVMSVERDGETRRVVYREAVETGDGTRLLRVDSLSSAEGSLYERLFESIPVGVVLFDRDGRIAAVNRRAETLLGYDREELVGTDQTDGQFIGTDARDEESAEEDHPFNRVIQSGHTVYEQELTYRRPDGTEALLSVSSAALFDDDGAITNVVTTFNDISLRTEYEELLQHQNERLDEFASIISHDLRSPIAVASGWLEVARQDQDFAALEKVDRSLVRMERLVTDVLALARQGQTVDAPEPVVLEPAVRAAWENTDAPEATLRVVDDLGTVLADELRLGELFENLFRNAVEHVGPTVTVTVGRLDDGGFYVADDGPGIPAEKREKVMEYGFTTSDSGTGFGLAILQAIAVAHGWEVTLTEAEGGGALFEFAV